MGRGRPELPQQGYLLENQSLLAVFRYFRAVFFQAMCEFICNCFSWHQHPAELPGVGDVPQHKIFFRIVVSVINRVYLHDVSAVATQAASGDVSAILLFMILVFWDLNCHFLVWKERLHFKPCQEYLVDIPFSIFPAIAKM